LFKNAFSNEHTKLTYLLHFKLKKWEIVFRQAILYIPSDGLLQQTSLSNFSIQGLFYYLLNNLNFKMRLAESAKYGFSSAENNNRFRSKIIFRFVYSKKIIVSSSGFTPTPIV
jgi:hypothetical protein